MGLRARKVGSEFETMGVGEGTWGWVRERGVSEGSMGVNEGPWG